MAKMDSNLEEFTNHCNCKSQRKRRGMTFDVFPRCSCTLTVLGIIDLCNNKNGAPMKKLHFYSGWAATTQIYMALKVGLPDWDVTRTPGKNIKLQNL